jgi:hypothetical protein
MKTILAIIFAALLVSLVQADIATSSPVATTVWEAEKAQTITWVENPKKQPPLAKLTAVKIELMTGAPDKHVRILTITEKVNALDLKFEYKTGVPKNAAASGKDFFLRYTDGDYVNFSSRFAINGLTGQTPTGDAGDAPPTPNNGTNTPAGGSPAGGYGGSGGSSGGASGGSSGGSSTTPSSTTSSSSSPASKPTNSANAAAVSGASLKTIHVAAFITVFVGMIITNFI